MLFNSDYNFDDLLDISYFISGLRGAISYALSLHLEFSDETRHVIITTTLIIVLFTTLFFGGSTMPLLKFLRVSPEYLFHINNSLTNNIKYTHHEIILSILNT